MQNNAARLVKRSRKSEHVTPLMKDLHWLPVKQRIQYKVNLVTFKAINGLAPVYIQQLIQVYEPSRSLRSAALRKLVEPRSHKRRSGDRAFRNCAPRLWNNLPHVTSYRMYHSRCFVHKMSALGFIFETVDLLVCHLTIVSAHI